VDVVPCEALKTGLNPLGLEIGYLADPLSSPPAKDRSASRSALGLPEDVEILGCIGGIDRRKGADYLIRAASSIRANQRILLAGKFAPEILDQLEKIDPITQSRLILVNRFLDHDEMFSYICSLDAMLMVQPGHTGISSFALHAVKYGIPVIGSDTPWFQFLKEQFTALVAIVNEPEALGEYIEKWNGVDKPTSVNSQKFDLLYSVNAFCQMVKSELQR
jgi:glycosyltransferase involved in cell wall biosynthesis